MSICSSLHVAPVKHRDTANKVQSVAPSLLLKSAPQCPAIELI